MGAQLAHSAKRVSTNGGAVGVRRREGRGQIQKCCTLQLFLTVIEESIEVRNAVGLEPNDQLALLRHGRGVFLTSRLH